MTSPTADLIHTLRQGATITPKLVRKIIAALERAMTTDSILISLVAEHQALHASQKNKVMFTREECGYLEDAMQRLTVCEALLIRAEAAINASVSGLRRVGIPEWSALLAEMQAATGPLSGSKTADVYSCENCGRVYELDGRLWCGHPQSRHCGHAVHWPGTGCAHKTTEPL